MKKAGKITGIIVLSIAAICLLIYAVFNWGIAASVIESAIKEETGNTVVFSRLHVKAIRHFPKVIAWADSVTFEDSLKSMKAVAYHPNVQVRIGRKKLTGRVKLDSVYFNALDSLDVRVRGIDAKCVCREDSLVYASAECSLRKSFARFGSNRCVLNNMAMRLDVDNGDAFGRITFAKLDIDEGKLISTCFPLLSRIEKVSLEMDDETVFINEVAVKSGTTDVRISGFVGNLMDFIWNDEDLEVEFGVLSKNVNANEIVAAVSHGKFDSKKEYLPSEEENEDFIEPGKYAGYPFKIEKIIPLLIPQWLKMSGDLHIDRGVISVCKASNVSAHLDVMDKTAKFSDCKLDTNFGNVAATLFYSSQSKDNLLSGFDVSVKNTTAEEIVKFLPKSENIAPLLNSFQGKFSCKATAVTKVDTALVPIPKTMKGVVNFKGVDMCISDAGNLRKYTSLLMFRNKNIGDIDNISMYSIISDNKVKIFPVLIGVDRFQIAMSGSHSFANSFDYDISVLKSPIPFKFGFALHSEGKKSKVKFRFKNPQFEDANLPTYYQEIDVAHRHLSSVIGNVLEDGVDMTQFNSSRITKNLFDSHREIKASDLDLNEESVRDSVKHYYTNLDSLKLLKLKKE